MDSNRPEPITHMPDFAVRVVGTGLAISAASAVAFTLITAAPARCKGATRSVHLEWQQRQAQNSFRGW